GMVRVASPGLEHDPGLPTEAVGIGLPVAGWDGTVMAEAARAGAVVLGPGLGRSAPNEAAVHHITSSVQVPLLVDGDGLTLLGDHVAAVVARR
ncbi:NAD(P)H-hydrate dehydratase, partial [Staphylococcus aureus]